MTLFSTMGFAGLKVLSLESRRADDMAALIRRFQGDPFVAPSVAERPLDATAPSAHFVERVEAGEFDAVVFMTGVGLAFLRDSIATTMSIERLATALRKVTIISRGPKPVPLLRAMSVPVTVTIPEPNTWREIVAVLASRPERRIAIQEYGRPNADLTAALECLGAHVATFATYRWELPADTGPLRHAAAALARREFDVVLFTSSIQLHHLLLIAEEMGIEDNVRTSLREHAAIASVGPVMTTALAAARLPPDIVPAQPKMSALVKAASEQAGRAILLKRQSVCRGPLHSK